jgi:hypothetical protein
MISLVLAGSPAQQPTEPKIWSSEEVAFASRPRPEFPQSARVNNGAVELICTVTARGAFSRCQIESETPPGNGFGREAVIAMQRGARIEMAENGPAEGDRVRATLRFSNGR